MRVIDHRHVVGALHVPMPARPEDLPKTGHPSLALALGHRAEIDKRLALFGGKDTEGELFGARFGAANYCVRRYPDAARVFVA